MTFTRIHLQLASLVALTSLVFLSAPVSRASIIYYSSRTSFDAAEPGLPVETFQPINQPGLVGSPLSSTQNNSNFQPGNILPGITITSGGSQLFVINGSVGNFQLSFPLVLGFNPGVRAVATDVYASTGFSPSETGAFTADIFSGATQIGATNFNEVAFGTAFLGLSSTVPITKVVLSFQPTTDLDWSPFVNNIAFGPTAATPEPRNGWQLALAVLLWGLVSWKNRR